MIQNKAYKFRFYPTKDQRENLLKTFGCCRFVYNKFLDIRSTAWSQERKSIGFAETCRNLTLLKKDPQFQFLGEVGAVPLQCALKNLDQAFTNFFKKTAEHPEFKKKRDGGSATYQTNAFSFKNGKLKLAKHSEPLNIMWSREIPKSNRILSITISMDASERFFVSFSCEEDIQPLPPTNKTIGIDVGLTNLATMSDGTTLANPRHLKRKQRRLAIATRSHKRKQKGSNKRKKANKKTNKIYAKMADSRKDYINKFTTKMVRENQAIYVETLDVVRMMKNGEKNLSKSIGDASWGMIFRQLEYKCEWYGRTFIRIDQFYPSSKVCSCCGHLLDSLPLSKREWDCPRCKTHHDRDLNAAINIKKYVENVPGWTPGNSRPEDTTTSVGLGIPAL